MKKIVLVILFGFFTLHGYSAEAVTIKGLNCKSVGTSPCAINCFDSNDKLSGTCVGNKCSIHDSGNYGFCDRIGTIDNGSVEAGAQRMPEPLQQ